MEPGEGSTERRDGKRYRPSDPDAVELVKVSEKRHDASSRAEKEEEEGGKTYAKRQILESPSAVELLNRAKTLIEDDWLGHIEEMPGNIFSVAAFGALFGKLKTGKLATGAKTTERLVGFAAVSIVQLVGAPAVFITTAFGKNKFNFGKITWENKFADWETIPLTKFLGVIFLITFIINGFFFILKEKRTWFKIYGTFKYLRRNTPNFEVRGVSFLYFGAFVNCWTVLWCCISSLVVIGDNADAEDVLMDALGMLFLFNLDDIGGDLGFVNGDDWPGLRLAWIYEEMVEQNWRPSDAHKEVEEAKEEAQEAAAKGWDAEQQRSFTTCRRARSSLKRGLQDHEQDQSAEGVDGTEEPEPKEAYSRRGWAVFILFQVTIYTLGLLSWLFPLVAVFTPFTVITPDFDD